MVPCLLPGDRLLVARLHRPRPGDLVAVRDPRLPHRRLVKRVASVPSAGLDVRGDAPARSTDSRLFGPVPETSVVGIVLYRYGPPGRPGLRGSRRRMAGGAVPSVR
jgi:signal peptidase I